jgi:hypothetical protein
LNEGDRDTAMNEAESGIHAVEHGFADYTLAPRDTFLGSAVVLFCRSKLAYRSPGRV